MAKGFGNGSQLYQQRAKAALPILIAQAKAGNTITYGQLAKELKMRNARNLNHVLGAIGNELGELSRQWGKPVPAVNCLVVNKHNKTPGRGIGFHMPVAQFKKLSPLARQRILVRLNDDIWGYGDWDKVLRHYGIAPAIPAKNAELEAIAKTAKYGKAGGETPDHRRLKEFIAQNPAVVGLPAKLNGTVEYTFLSADKIDVLFTTATTWIGAEIKGPNSDPADIVRGIFQCVKYQALIEAAQRYEQVSVESRVILVLGGALPTSLLRLVDLLKIEVKQEIEVPASFHAQTNMAKGAAQ